MMDRIKSAWLVLTGRARAVPYYSVYKDVMHQIGAAGVKTILDLDDILKKE